MSEFQIRQHQMDIERKFHAQQNCDHALALKAADELAKAANHFWHARKPKCDCSAEYGGRCFSCGLIETLAAYEKARGIEELGK